MNTENGKKIFLVWAGNGSEIVEMISDFEKAGHGVVYWVGVGENSLANTKLVFHDHIAATEGKPAPGFEKLFVPPSEELIEKMRKTESIVLTMMIKMYEHLGVDERRHIYFQMLGYWDNVFRHFKPAAAIFPAVPHTVYNYIIYELARLHGVQTIMMEDTWMSDRMIFYEDWRVGSLDLAKRIVEYKDKKFKLEDLPQDLQEFYKTQTNPVVDATPTYMQDQKRRFSDVSKLKIFVKKTLNAILDGSFTRRFFGFISRKLKPNLIKEYKSLECVPGYDKPYVYAPLCYQPERTTCPQGDAFMDQILMVETLSAALPLGWEILVKEHPSQLWFRTGAQYSSVRYEGYYRRLASLPNVKIVPITTDTFKLIKEAKAVATVTGTAGFEALVRSVPAIIFGYAWYRNCPDIFKVNDIASCKSAFEKIKDGFRPRSERMINYLKAFDEITVRGFLDIQKYSAISRETTMKNITSVILDRL